MFLIFHHARWRSILLGCAEFSLSRSHILQSLLLPNWGSGQDYGCNRHTPIKTMVLWRSSGYSTLVCSLKFVLCLPQNNHHGGDLWLQCSVYIWVTKIMRITHYFAYVQQYWLHCKNSLVNCFDCLVVTIVAQCLVCRSQGGAAFQ